MALVDEDSIDSLSITRISMGRSYSSDYQILGWVGIKVGRGGAGAYDSLAPAYIRGASAFASVDYEIAQREMENLRIIVGVP
jgi:hypothetical protein